MEPLRAELAIHLDSTPTLRFDLVTFGDHQEWTRLRVGDYSGAQVLIYVTPEQVDALHDSITAWNNSVGQTLPRKPKAAEIDRDSAVLQLMGMGLGEAKAVQLVDDALASL